MAFQKDTYYTGAKTNSRSAAETGLAKFMNTVYLWMAVGVALSGAVAQWILSSPALLHTIFSGGMIFGIFIVQLVCVFAFNSVARRCSYGVLAALFLFYCGLTGLTFSVILLAYTKTSITQAFIAAAASFAALSLIGLKTKRSLGPVRSFCMVGLVGLIVVQLIGFFVPSLYAGAGQQIISSIGVLVFAGLTAYDNQRLKQAYLTNHDAGQSFAQSQKLALSGALTLYLDFINLFLFLLRLTGSRR